MTVISAQPIVDPASRKRGLMKSKPFLLCSLLIVAVILATWMTPFDPAQADFLNRLSAPGAANWFGTDHLGRDIATRILYGGFWSLGLSFVISFIGLVVGTMVGLIAARSGKAGDFTLMRMTDSFFAFPELAAAVAIAGLFGPSTANLVIALICVSWMKFARLSRSLTLTMGERDFVTQAKLNGLSPGAHSVASYPTEYPALTVGSMDQQLVTYDPLCFRVEFPGLWCPAAGGGMGCHVAGWQTLYADRPAYDDIPGPCHSDQRAGDQSVW